MGPQKQVEEKRAELKKLTRDFHLAIQNMKYARANQQTRKTKEMEIKNLKNRVQMLESRKQVSEAFVERHDREEYQDYGELLEDTEETLEDEIETLQNMDADETVEKNNELRDARKKLLKGKRELKDAEATLQDKLDF